MNSLTIPMKSPELPGLGIIYQFAQMDVRDVRDVFFCVIIRFFFFGEGLPDKYDGILYCIVC